MSSKVSRRQFLKYCAAAAATIPVMQLAASVHAAPKKRVAQRALEAAGASPFGALPSSLPLGAPLADISMGIDGTVWGIDVNGVPHRYDHTAQNWQVYGQSLSALAYVSRWNGGTASGSKYDKPLAVWGTLVSPPEGFISTIADTWPTLPDTFQTGLDGAAEADGALYLFRHGRFVRIDPDTSAAGAPTLLTSITNWPTTGNWIHGAITAVGSNLTDPAAKEVNFWCDGSVVTVNMTTTTVVAGPKALSDVVSGQMLAVMSQGFDAELFASAPYAVQVAQGPVKWVSIDPAGAATPTYMEADPQWNPRFKHAPTGRIGELWAVRTDGTPINHNGEGWQEITTTGYEFINISMGSDGAVFGLSHFDNGQFPFNVWQLAADGHTFTGFMVFGAAAGAVQVSAGDADHVWLLDAAGNVYRAAADGFQLVDTIGLATHIAANADGTVWHARGDAFAHRFISEGQNPSTALAVAPAGSTVQRVASTGFGTGYFLTQPSASAAGGSGDPQMYSYDSLYVWKTSNSYTPQLDYLGLSQSMIAVGNILYLVSHLANVSNQGNARVAALDKQTGEELWRVDFNNLEWLGTWAQLTLTHDPALGLLYVIVGGNLHAINAQTGDQVYTIPIKTNLEVTSQLSPATLYKGQLCFADAYNQHIYMVDTAAALALAKAGQTPTAAFIAVVLGSNESRWLGAPLFDPTTDIFYLVSMDPGARFPALSAYRTSGAMLWDAVFNQVPDSTYTLAHDVLFGATTDSDGATTVQALFVNTGGAVVAVDHATGAILHTFTPDANAVVSSALTYWNGRLYFGDVNGTLYVIDANTFALVAKTQDAKQAAWHGVLAHPAIVHSHSDDGDESVAVYFARGDANIWLFDPESGNVESIMTDQSTILSVLYDDVHGVLYGCAGWWATLTVDQSLGQVFAICPDRAIQDARDFIIESQLMQDFASDDEANGDGIARYQTHVSVVDDNKAPRGNVAMRLWADEEGIDVTIDGTPYTIGPDTPAVFTTDAAGACTILSAANGDMASATLRLWAAFMNVHERITIQTDVEFHRRLASNTSTGADDPRKIDMQSASSYDGTPLFSDAGQAQQTSGAVAQTMGAVGMGQTSSSLVAAGADPGKYFAYANLPGMGYSPVNVAVNRAVTPVAALGIHLNGTGINTMSVADAANLIDGLQGDVAAAEILSFASDIKAWWKSVKNALQSIEQVVVAVGNEIVVGIEYIVNGVKQVLKAVIRDIKDAALAIGAFFVQLGKDILKVIEALSIFLHLGKVVDTAKIIRGFVSDAFTKMETILSEGKTYIDSKLLYAEDEITQDFCLLYENLGLPIPPECTTGASILGGSTPLGGFGNMGATPTTVYNQGSGSGQPSQAVQCGWSGHSLRNNAAQATTPAQGASVLDEDALIGLVTSFVDSLTGNAELAAAYQGVGATFQATFKAASVDQFLKMAVEDLLELAKAALITGVALVKAIIDTILASIESVVAVLQDITSVTIPILSALWKKITGEDLTVLDLIAFVVAFPVTFMYKAFDGAWPGDSVSAAETMPRTLRNIKGLMGATASTLSGIFSTMEDTDPKGVEPSFLRKMSALLTEITENGLGVVDAAYAGDAASIMTVTSSWIDLGVSLISPKLPKAYEGADEVVKFFTGLFNFFIYAGQGGEAAEIARGIVGSIPALVVWAKHIKGPVELIPPIADIMCGLAVAGIELGITFAEWNKEDEEVPAPERLRRHYLPLVGNPQTEYVQLFPTIANGR